MALQMRRLVRSAMRGGEGVVRRDTVRGEVT